MSDLAFTSSLDQARLVRDREVSSRELVEHYLARIEEHDGRLNAYVHVLADRALATAGQKDEETAALPPDDLPPLHGVPVAIKELSFLEGAPATLATSAMKSFVAPFDDEAVARLLGAGMVPLGKTNASELGSVPVSESELHGPCRNPWNVAHTPGGSSGGAGAALAAGLCPVAQGSDGGGSIRIPASNCGVVGLKPSRDRVSRAPLFGDHGFGLVTDGMLTRTVAETAAFLDLLSGHVPGDPGIAPPPERPFTDEVGRAPRRLRIGVASDTPVGTPTPAVLRALEDARGLLEELGHDPVEVTVGANEAVVEAFGRVWSSMIASQPIPPDTLEPINRWHVERGRALSAPEYLAAQFTLQLFCRGLQARFHEEFDVLLTPVLTDLPLRVGATDGLEPEEAWRLFNAYCPYTPLANASGQPAISLPLHWDEETGLPVGAHLVGRLAGEATLIRLAAQVEEARPWADRRPPGFS